MGSTRSAPLPWQEWQYISTKPPCDADFQVTWTEGDLSSWRGQLMNASVGLPVRTLRPNRAAAASTRSSELPRALLVAVFWALGTCEFSAMASDRGGCLPG